MTIAWRALTGLLLVVAGCGGGSPEPDPKDPEGAVKIMFEEYQDAVASQDWKRACAQTAPEYIAKQYGELVASGVTDVPADCVAMWEYSVKSGSNDVDRMEDASEDAKLDRVYVNKDTARVDYTQVEDDGRTTGVIMDARPGKDGHWLITNHESAG